MVIRHPGAWTGYAHVLLSLDVPGLQLLIAEWPVQHIGAFDIAVFGAHAKLEVAKAQGHTGPVYGTAAHRLDDPGRQVRMVARHVPAAGGDAFIEPGNLVEHRPLIVFDVGHLVTLASFQHYGTDSLFGQAWAESRHRARANDDDDIAIVLGEFRCHGVNPHCWNGWSREEQADQSQSRSLKPRAI